MKTHERMAFGIMMAALVSTASAGTSAGATAKPEPKAPAKAPAAGEVKAPVPGEVKMPAAGAAKAPAAAVAKAPASTTPAPSRTADSTYTLKAGQDGTVFKSLTVEGEDRIHFEFDRPVLQLDLDPEKAPGLEWGSARDVLNRTTPDLLAPLTAVSALETSPYVARPWLSRFSTGAVARFQPAVQGVERWTLTVANSKGETVTQFQGKGEPPHEITWDGRSKSGNPVAPGVTYSYVFEAIDRAGNKRNFVGAGFDVPAYRLESPDGPVLLFSARELAADDDATRPAPGREATPPIVLEAATWINQSPRSTQPVRMTAVARSAERANQLSSRVAHQLAPWLIGDPARVQSVAEVQPDAPENGILRIAIAH